jgi:hypothetical protein
MCRRLAGFRLKGIKQCKAANMDRDANKTDRNSSFASTWTFPKNICTPYEYATVLLFYMGGGALARR